MEKEYNELIKQHPFLQHIVKEVVKWDKLIKDIGIIQLKKIFQNVYKF